MAGKAKGPMAKTRKKFRRKKGILKVNKILAKYEPGTKVQIDTDSSFHRGLPFRRYHGKIATVKKMRGNCCELTLMSGNKPKLLIVHPVHLKPVNMAKKKEAAKAEKKEAVKTAEKKEAVRATVKK